MGGPFMAHFTARGTFDVILDPFLYRYQEKSKMQTFATRGQDLQKGRALRMNFLTILAGKHRILGFFVDI